MKKEKLKKTIQNAVFLFFNFSSKTAQKYVLLLITGLTVLLIAGPLYAQSVSEQIYDLQQQIQELEEQASQYKGTIAQKQKEASSLKNQIAILNNQILTLQTKIKITETEIDQTALQIGELSGEILDVSNSIETHKNAMASIIRTINDMDSRTLIASVLANATFSDFMNMLDQSENVERQLIDQVDTLKELRTELENKKHLFEGKKEELENLNTKLSGQKLAADGTKGEKDYLLRVTRGQESKYRQLLNEVERKKAEFFARLQELEREARKEGVFIVEIQASNLPPKGTRLFSYPYDDYIFTQGYGFTDFARRGAYGGAGHNGIDIVAGNGSPIRSIGDGEVVASGYNNGWGNWIAIKHAYDLVSLYGHMKFPTHISVGEQVDASTVIGYEGTTGNVTGSHLHLSLYREFFTYISRLEKRVYFNYFDGTIDPLDYL